MLQEKIAEVMESRNSPVKNTQERGGVQNQVWPKDIGVLSQNYMNQGKSGKHSNKHTIGTKESTDYHHSKGAQSTYHRY